MRKTKIVCTLGPSTVNKSMIMKLLQNGMNVARINFSHGSHEEHQKTIDEFKKCRKKLKNSAALLLDTKGPEIRLGSFENEKIILKTGQKFTLVTSDSFIGNEEKAWVTYHNLHNEVDPGDTILLDDGNIELKVLTINGSNIKCEVINGGIVSDKKSLNVPNVSLNLPLISTKDEQDILFGIKNDFDFIAASFAQNALYIKNIKKILAENGGNSIKIIAKIENREGVKNIDEIIRVSDGIMVARGDMGVEIPFEELPGIQKRIIKQCYTVGKPVITATQMLESMIRNPRPTRAEITDVANAVYDGTSALMLSGETAVGSYPIETLNTMAKIAVEAEHNIDYHNQFKMPSITVTGNVTNAISLATCEAAHSLGAAAIISVTKSGHTARVVSKCRPACPIIASTISMKVYNQLALSWGVHPVLSKFKESTDKIFEGAVYEACQTGIVKNGDLVVITGGMPVGISGTTNTLKVHIIGDVLLEGESGNKKSATGNIFVANKNDDNLDYFNSGDVLVISQTTEKILKTLKYASALITEEDKASSNAVIVAFALEIPVIYNAVGATEILKSGTIISVDASKGLVYSGMKL
ncbi:MAG: pyruvate kinase [Chitinispirillia bacterium]|jgi:pyruvate kinase